MLLLTDPRNAGPVSARYRNKRAVAPRMVIFAVTTNPVDFGFFVPGKRSTSDSLDQLLARISLLIEVEMIDGEPRYTVSRMGEVLPYERRVAIPDSAAGERLELTYGPVDTAPALSLGEMVGTVLAAVGEHCPDVALDIPSDALAARDAAIQTHKAAETAAAAERQLKEHAQPVYDPEAARRRSNELAERNEKEYQRRLEERTAAWLCGEPHKGIPLIERPKPQELTVWDTHC
jgi:hypothetical protein